jgi:predicted nucleotidyltransferase
MHTREAGLRYAKQYLDAVMKTTIQIDKAIMFGSYAKNTAQEYSDIDLALISKDFTDNPIENVKMLPVSMKFAKIEPHLFTWKDYQGGDPFLIEEILKTGIEIPLHD